MTLKTYNVNIDYTECYSVEAHSKKEAIKKAIKNYDREECLVNLSHEAEFSID